MSVGASQNVKVQRGIFTERTWTKELPFLHYAIGAVFFALAFINNYVDPDFLHHVVDFWVYYRAATVAHLLPEHIYNSAYFDYPLPRADGISQIYPYINPPPFLLLIYPLGYFSSQMAVMLWTGFNLFLTFLLYRNIAILAQDIPSPSYRAILKSLVFGLYAWSWAMYNGQVSIILAFAISCFLIAWKQERFRQAMFWLALGLAIKPHYFIPVTLFLLGNRQYRHIAIVTMWLLLFACLTLAIGGIGLWISFVEEVLRHSKTATYYIMVNLRGILLLYTPSFLADKILVFCSFLFALTALSAFVAGHRYYKKGLSFPLEALCFWFIAAMYFCPWMHQHDFYLLLPLIVCLMPQLLRYKRHMPLLISYSFVLLDFVLPGFSILSNRITITFAFFATLFLLHDLRVQRASYSRPALP